MNAPLHAECVKPDKKARLSNGGESRFLGTEEEPDSVGYDANYRDCRCTSGENNESAD